MWGSAAAVGNPFSAGTPHAGETVVDVGCGAGADVCIAALLVGAAGKVYGFDATPAMVAKASANALAAGLLQGLLAASLGRAPRSGGLGEDFYKTHQPIDLG